MSRLRNALRDTARALRRAHAAPRREPDAPPAGRSDDADSNACGCCGAGPYLLAVTAQAIILLQFDADPSVGGLSGAMSSLLRIAPSWAWQSAHVALALLGIGIYAFHASARMLAAWFAVAAIVAAGALTESFALENWIQPTPELGLRDGLRIAVFLVAPATAVTLFNRLTEFGRGAAAIALGVVLAAIVSGWVIANVDSGAFTEEERPYAESLENARDQYPCDFGFHPQGRTVKGGRLLDYAAGITDIEILSDGEYGARVRVNNIWGIPSYGAYLRFSQEAIMAARPDYLSACLIKGPDRRALKPYETGGAYLAPWRWRRSADGGASWADVSHSPHRQSAETEGYTYRYVPTKADLAGANILLRACVDVRGGGEVCSPGVSPRP